MYSYEWDVETGGYLLTTKQEDFVAMEIRPVFAEELKLLGMDRYFEIDGNAIEPYLWAKRGLYYYKGEKVAEVVNVRLGSTPECKYFVPPQKLRTVNIDLMLSKNRELMDSLVSDTKARVKEMYDESIKACDVAYLSFSGGKDSMVLLDICHDVLPLECPVVFCDTDMELPDTYLIWEQVQERYPGRVFIRAKAHARALDNWKRFGPPSRDIRWCCAVHKSTPALLALRKYKDVHNLRALAFVGVRSAESLSRSSYDDVGVGVKNNTQINAMPLLRFGAHEVFHYMFAHKLLLHKAYRMGLARVGCVLCPESSERTTWLISNINNIYQCVSPGILEPYYATLRDSYAREFSSEEDEKDFFARGRWKARMGGNVLKHSFRQSSEVVNGNIVSWQIPTQRIPALQRWLSTMGTLVPTGEGDELALVHSNAKLESCGSIFFAFAPQKSGITVFTCRVEKLVNVKYLMSYLHSSIHKAIACVACRVCEANCPTGALDFSDDEVRINVSLCVHCMRCHNIQYGCWRYFSMRVTEVSSNSVSKMNQYYSFGLRADWLPVYMKEGAGIVHTTQLGTKMIDSAKRWFPQALLMQAKTYVPTKLMELVKLDASSQILWDNIWFALANNSILVKWFILNTKLNENCSMDYFNVLLNDFAASNRSKILSSLKELASRSPIGTSSNPIIAVDYHRTKNTSRVVGLKRLRHSIENLTLLYSYYVMAGLTGRSSFTISEMMATPEITSAFISPIIAFGVDPEEVKVQSRGLASKYPSFINCNFTLGLDEINLYPQQNSLDDVIDLILRAR